jgi:hypothetical protein
MYKHDKVIRFSEDYMEKKLTKIKLFITIIGDKYIYIFF